MTQRPRTAKMDNREFHTLCKEHTPLLQRFLLARGASPDEVDDLIQETLAIAWRKRDIILNGKAFLTSTAWNLLQVHRRKKSTRKNLAESRRDALAEAFHPSHNSPRGPHARLIQQEHSQRVAKLIEGLPPRMAQVIRLTYIEGLSQSEAARRLGINPATVSGTIKTALARLRRLARGEFP